MKDNVQLKEFAFTINEGFSEFVSKFGLSESATSVVSMMILLFLAVLIIYIVFTITERIIHLISRNISKFDSLKFFKFLNKNKFPMLSGLLIPYIFMKIFIPIVFYNYSVLTNLSYIFVEVWLIFVIINIIVSIVRSACDVLALRPAFRDKPMTSYIQVLQIILYILGIVLAFSVITDKSPMVFFTAMGAASAIMLLIFQDSIKGFVASIQVTTNDMVRLGDWVTVSKYGADGDVTEINLTTVKVQNFDKTITTLPTYALISDSFQNWRGMKDAEGRRIKRSLSIKQSSIRFIADDELARFKKIQGISKYIDEKQAEIKAHNEAIGADRSLPVNGRNLTNAGLFRQYAQWYLKTHPGTKDEYTMMVRHLAPTETGIPFEVYAFTNTTNWIQYEAIMSDIFDHLIATVKYFDLEIFELEAGGDKKNIEIRN
ncbi:miniconductance mechanosensitive channel [Dysgonomonadaceae bacterium PH5-43]|nr:miniconductance mechanosensitive channel [Dysgonomonadaceae bacterium PH5-43]